MNNKLVFLTVCTLSTLTFFSCKQKSMVVNPGAVVSKDGSDDGLNNVKSEFKDASRTNEGIKFTLSSDVLFPTNSSYLSDGAKGELNKLVQLLKNDSKKRVRVEGHTDATGEEKYNQWLSDKRATSVKVYLEQAGVSASRVSTEGFGQSRPVGDNKTAEGRKLNRRVEIVILD